jgi:hypothetical protein
LLPLRTIPNTAQNNLWCFSNTIPEGGRPYHFTNYVMNTVSLIDLIDTLQLLPPACDGLRDPLKVLLLSNNATDSLTLESATSLDKTTPPSLEWWEDEFLPAATNAFSCGFTDADKTTNAPDRLPNDIRQAFVVDDNLVVQQAWRLTKSYLRSPQHQRGPPRAQQDFDMSLYVPFLPPTEVPLARLDAVRSGFPTYQGPATWYLWHTIAARYAQVQDKCYGPNNSTDVDGFPKGNDHVLASKVLPLFKRYLAYYGTTHPCPYCREHFQSRVSRNDMDWRAFGLTNTMDPSQSESNLYPLEYLFVAGVNASSISEKMATITDANSFLLFLWKAHNTVNAAVARSLQCKTEEQADIPVFQCQNEGPTYGEEGTASTKNLGRAWPTARRFAFWIQEQGLFENLRNSSDLVEAYRTLHSLEEEYGDILRQTYWTAADGDGGGNSKNNKTGDALMAAQQVVDAAETLDQAVLNSNVLVSEYALWRNPVNCDTTRESLTAFEPLLAPLPFLEDGNYVGYPEACQATFENRRLLTGKPLPFAAEADSTRTIMYHHDVDSSCID